MGTYEHVLNIELPAASRQLPAILTGEPCDRSFDLPVVECSQDAVHFLAISVSYAGVDFRQNNSVNRDFVRAFHEMSHEAKGGFLALEPVHHDVRVQQEPRQSDPSVSMAFHASL